MKSIAFIAVYVAFAAVLAAGSTPASPPTAFAGAATLKTLCDFEVAAPPDSAAPPQQDSDEKASKEELSETPAEIDELIKEGKLAAATAAVDQWVRSELAVLEAAALAKANAMQSPREEVQKIILTEKTALLKYAKKLELPNWEGLDKAKQIMEIYAGQKLPALYREGKVAAKAGPPEVPPQAHEIIAIDKDVQVLGGKVPGDADGLDYVKDIVAIWTDTLGKKLYHEGRKAARLGGKAAPPEVRKMIEIDREAALLGIEGRGLERALDVLYLWADSMTIKRLRLAKPKVAAPAQEPPAELKEILDASNEFKSVSAQYLEKMRERAVTEAHKWFRQHVKRYAANANANGAPVTPAQIDSILSFASANNCLDVEQAGAYKAAVDAARELGEQNFNAYKDKLPCEVTDEQKETAKKLASELEAKGWGPYDPEVPACGWQGTIAITMIYESDKTKEHRGGGSGVRERIANQDTFRYEVKVAGTSGEGRMSGNGRERVVRKSLTDGCMVDSLDIATTISRAGSAIVPVEIKENFGGRFLIDFPDIEFTMKREIVTFRNHLGSGCTLPFQGGTETKTNVHEMKPSPPGNRILTDPGTPIPGSKQGMVLKGVSKFETPGAKSITEYDLKRAR
ncbi:MAG: hypothetical protein ACT4O1_07560 [Gemmatimonadota bacterium]